MTPPVFYLLAGPNGAGKSTLYRAAVAERLIPADIEFVNADLFEAAELTQVVDPKARSEQARLWADRRRAALLAAGRSFVSETVFSHPSKLQLMKDAVRLADLALLYDTSAAAIQPPRLVARCRRGLPPVVPGKLPTWAAGVLAD